MKLKQTILFRVLTANQNWLTASLLALTFFAFDSTVFAQDTVTGAFEGTVTNSVNGEPIGGALIEIRNEQTGVTYNLVSDSKGRFYQGLLAPGVYLIRAAFDGFQPRTLRRQLKVAFTGEIVPVPVALEPATAVTPTPQPSPTASPTPGASPSPTPAAPPAGIAEEANNIRTEINTSDARRDASFKQEELNNLPLGGTTVTRSFDELATLAPGLAPPPQTVGDVAGPGVGSGVGSAGQFAANGLRSRGNNFTVDGSDNNDEDIGVRRQGFVSLVPQPIESVQEYQVIALLPPAQFGRNIGAQVNAVSKSGGNRVRGSVYGFFNGNDLNAKNTFDTANGSNSFALRTQSNQAVLLDGSPLTVRNGSGGEDSFTFYQAGGVLGGAIIENKTFYFLSGEYAKINAVKEKNFAVPTIEQRGIFRSGATGVFRNPFTGANVNGLPNTLSSAALFSLFPFPNNPGGVYGANTFTQTLPASGDGVILSGKIDHNFDFGGRAQSITGRYNFTGDERFIPSVNEALFSTLLSRIRTDNLSVFYNSQLSRPNASRLIFNQVRFSVGRTRLNFDEVRDTEFLIPSGQLPNERFLLNAPYRLNVTQAQATGVPNTGDVNFRSFFQAGTTTPRRIQAEEFLGPIGQVSIAGFSPIGTDVYNFPQNRVDTTFQLADELTLRFGGHSAVFGFDGRQSNLNSNLPRLSRPLITFSGAPRLIRDPLTGNLRFPTAADPNPIIRAEDLAGLGAASNFLLTFNVERDDARARLRFYQFNFYGQDTWRVRPDLSLSYGLRYEYNSPVHEIDRNIERTFRDERLPILPGLQRVLDGRENLYEADKNNFAPRLGLAYSPNFFNSNNRLTVVRVGYGLFYDQILGAVVNQSRNVFPTFLTLNLNGLQTQFGGQTLLTLNNPAAQTFNGLPVLRAGSVNQFNPAINLQQFVQAFTTNFPNAINSTLPAKRLEMPSAHQYSASVEQQINRNLTISAAYVGTTGKNLLRFTTPNLGSSLTVAPTMFTVTPFTTPQGTLRLSDTFGTTFIPQRPIAGLGAVNQFETTAASRYDAFQMQLRGRFTSLFNFQMSYVYSKAEDEVSDVFDLAGAFVLPQNSLNLKAERADANFDVRHRLAYNAIFDLSRFGENGLARFFLRDLSIATTGRFHTGQPFTVNSTVDVNLDGNLTDRLNTLDGLTITGNGSQPLVLNNPQNPFALLAAFGQDGAVERNSFRAGKVLELDASVVKRFVFNEQSISFRTDFFNFINRANYGIPVRLLEAPGFGRAVNTVTPARRIQFSLKYEF